MWFRFNVADLWKRTSVESIPEADAAKSCTAFIKPAGTWGLVHWEPLRSGDWGFTCQLQQELHKFISHLQPGQGYWEPCLVSLHSSFQLWLRRVGRPWKQQILFPSQKQVKKKILWPGFVILLLILRNIMEYVLLEHIPECTKAVLLGNSHQRCAKCSLCLSSPSMTKWLDLWMVGKQWMLFRMSLVRFPTESLMVFFYWN